MARRRLKKSKVLPFRAGASNKPLATAPLYDSTRLLLERFISSQDAVVANANAAFDTFVRSLMKIEEINPEEGWMFNRQRMRWEQYPVPADA